MLETDSSDLDNPSSLVVDISTEVRACWNSRCTLQLIYEAAIFHHDKSWYLLICFMVIIVLDNKMTIVYFIQHVTRKTYLHPALNSVRFLWRNQRQINLLIWCRLLKVLESPNNTQLEVDAMLNMISLWNVHDMRGVFVICDVSVVLLYTSDRI